MVRKDRSCGNGSRGPICRGSKSRACSSNYRVGSDGIQPQQQYKPVTLDIMLAGAIGGTTTTRNLQYERQQPVVQIVEQVLQATPCPSDEPGTRPEGEQHSAASTNTTLGRGKRHRAKITAASLVLVRKRLRHEVTASPGTASDIPDEELSELLDLHRFGESVHWPSGWSAVKAAAHLAIPRQPG